MPVLFRAEQVARAAYFQIPHGNLKARAKLRKFAYGLQTLLRRFLQHFVPPVHQVCISNAVAAPHPSPELVKLGQTHAVGVLYDNRIHVGNVHACFDDGRADQNVQFPADKFFHDVFQFPFRHLPMRIGNAGMGNQLLQTKRLLADGFHTVVKVIHLPAARNFPVYGFADKFRIIFHNIRLHRAAFLRRLLQNTHVAYPRKAHVQCAWDRRCRQRQHTDVFPQTFQLFLMRHTEPLFLIYNDKAQILKFYVPGQKPVRADEDIRITALHIFQAFLLLFWRTET